jgi:hypothetical protein
MKRPKTKNMTEVEQIRLVVLKGRRRAQRGLREAKKLANYRKLAPEFQARLRRNIAFFETTIMLTKPSWVKNASLNELVPVLKHLCKDNTN